MSGKVLGNDPFKRGAASSPATPAPEAPKPAPASDVDRLAEKAKQLRSEKPLVEQLAPKVAVEPAPEKPAPPKPPPPPKPVMTPVEKPVEVKRLAPKPPPPPQPKLVVPKPKGGEGTPARRAVTSFASAPPAPKVTAPERPSMKGTALDRTPSLPARGAGRGEGAEQNKEAPRAESKPPAKTPPQHGSSFAAAPPPPSPPEKSPQSPARQPGRSSAVPPPPPTPPEKSPQSPAQQHRRPSAVPPAPPEPDATPPMDPVASSPPPRYSPRPNEHSPTFGGDPVAHSASPEGRHAPTFHDGSPELRAGFTPHDRSPDVVAELGPGSATPHSGSPAVVAELKDREAVPHLGSPEMVSGRATDVGIALEAARDATAGLARPLIEAGRGLAAAAKAALGFGSTGAVDTWGKDEALTRKLHPVGDFLYDKYFRVTVEGAELIPAGPSIIVANHSGALPLDGPILHYALQRERADLQSARWLVEDQVFHAPVLGVLINRLGAVRAHPENALKLLEEGRPVIVFPEGFLGISKPFTQRYQLKRFGRGGYVKLALKQKVPIVPVAIVGAEESMPLLAKLPGGLFGLPYLPLTPPPLPARWRIRFSEAIAVDGNPEDLAYVQEQNDLVRDTIAGMLTSMIA